LLFLKKVSNKLFIASFQAKAATNPNPPKIKVTVFSLNSLFTSPISFKGFTSLILLNGDFIITLLYKKIEF